MKAFIFLALFYSFGLIGDDFIIAGSANVQFAMNDLNQEYKKLVGKEFKSVTSSSGKLATQIQNGAPYSVFLSADMDYPLRLYNSGHAIDLPLVYAKGTIIIWSRKFKNLENYQSILLQPNLKFIAVANPDFSPYGIETINSLKFDGIFEKIQAKLIYAESISQVNQYILSQSVDIGFTAKSTIASGKMGDLNYWLELDSNSYNPIKQGVVILKYGWERNRKECDAFSKLLISKKGKQILKRNGYIVDEL